MDDKGQPKITQIRVGGARIGLRGLEDALKELCSKGIKDQEELKRALVKEIRKRQNYIAPSLEVEYEKALFREYLRFMGEPVEEEKEDGLFIKILGAGCPNCHRLTEEVMAALTSVGIAADVEHVTDVNRIADYGVIGTPALLVNGKVKSVGQVPSRNQIWEWINDEATRE